MQPQFQAVGLRGREYACGLFGREGDAFTKRIDGLGQLFAGDGRNHLCADPFDKGVRSACLGWNGMSAQKRGGDGDRSTLGQCTRRPQLLAFGVELESVSRLHLDSGGAYSEQTGAALGELRAAIDRVARDEAGCRR